MQCALVNLLHSIILAYIETIKALSSCVSSLVAYLCLPIFARFNSSEPSHQSFVLFPCLPVECVICHRLIMWKCQQTVSRFDAFISARSACGHCLAASLFYFHFSSMLCSSFYDRLRNVGVPPGNGKLLHSCNNFNEYDQH